MDGQHRWVKVLILHTETLKAFRQNYEHLNSRVEDITQIHEI